MKVKTLLPANAEILMQDDTHFLIKLPRSKYSLMCSCDKKWSVRIMETTGNESELLADNLKKKDLKAFIENIFSIEPESIDLKKIRKAL